jgi:hypothetical protein
MSTPRVAHLGELIPTDGLSSGFRSPLYVVRVNEHRKGIAEFFEDRPRHVVSSKVSIIDADDGRFFWDPFFSAPPGQEILLRDASDFAIFERLHLCLEIGWLDGKAVLRLVLESVVTKHDDL